MKLSLIIQNGSLSGQKFELTGGFLTIGRSENCAVRFDPANERIASSQHAFIEVKSDGFYLIDNRSTNGTFLNGQRIQIAKIKDGDTIQFGKNGVEAKVFIKNQVDVSQPTTIKQDYPPLNLDVPAVNQILQNQPVDLRNSISGLNIRNLLEQSQLHQTKKYVGVGIAIFSVVFLSLIVILLMVGSVGIGAAIVASIVAFTPAMIYILPLIWLDRYDPEPLWLLALAFAWGALVAVIVSFIVNTAIGVGIGLTIHPAVGELVSTVFSAPVFEEGSKGLGVILLLVFFRREFDDVLDGIVYAGVIALGFATVENVLYYGRGINEIGLYQTAEEGFAAFALLFGVRGILSPFAHVTFTAMTGIGCGISRESHRKFVRIIMPIVGYACAVSLHMLWNGMAVMSTLFFQGLTGFFIGYIVLEVPFFLIFVGFAFYVMNRQNKILKEMLAIDVVRGLIPQEHLDISTSAFRSSRWLLGSLFSGKFKARNSYLRAVGKLGLSYWHIQRATAAQGKTGSFQQNPILREKVLKWRDKV